MKKILIAFMLLFNLYGSNLIYGQNNSFCQTIANKSVSRTAGVIDAPLQPCKAYTIRVYIHRIKSTAGVGYTNTADDIVMDNLNNSYNQYGITFIKSGSRDWINNTYADANLLSIFSSIPSDGQNGFQSNAVNIYLLPASNTALRGGNVPDGFKQIILLCGTRTVTPCNGSPSNYEIPISKVVAHEMGHSFGLQHTFGETFNGDDGLSDTPFDNTYLALEPNTCVSSGNCGFVGSLNCSSCALASTQANLQNFMSYTVPTCMREFSEKQVNLMRYNLNNTMSPVVSASNITSYGPNLLNMTRGANISVLTVNMVSPGSHNIYSNVNPTTLLSNMNWSSTAPSSNWGVFGTKNTNAFISLNSGQNYNLLLNGTDKCGTTNRTLTFVAQSGFKIMSSAKVINTLTIEFDNVAYLEALPESISLYDEKSTKEEVVVYLKDIFDKKGFIENNRINIDVSKLSRGVKILRFIYQLAPIVGKQKTSVEMEVKTERVILIN